MLCVPLNVILIFFLFLVYIMLPILPPPLTHNQKTVIATWLDKNKILSIIRKSKSFHINRRLVALLLVCLAAARNWGQCSYANTESAALWNSSLPLFRFHLDRKSLKIIEIIATVYTWSQIHSFFFHSH